MSICALHPPPSPQKCGKLYNLVYLKDILTTVADALSKPVPITGVV